MNVPTPRELAMQKLARLHPETATEAGDLAYPAIKDKPHQKPYQPRGNYKTTIVRDEATFTVRPEVLKLALKMAGGDRARLELCHDGGVIIWNHPRNGHHRPKSRIEDVPVVRSKNPPPVYALTKTEDNRVENIRTKTEPLQKRMNPAAYVMPTKTRKSYADEIAGKVRTLQEGRKTPGKAPKLTAEQASAMFEEYKNPKTRSAALAEKYGLSLPTFHRYIAAEKAKRAVGETD